MGMLDDLFGSTLPGAGNLSRPVGAALLTLLERHSGASVQSGDQVQQAIPAALDSLVGRFEQNGHGDVIRSWIAPGPNRTIGPDELHRALGSDTVEAMSQRSGLSKEDLLAQLSQALPAIIDRLTPNGHIPEPGELSRSGIDL